MNNKELLRKAIYYFGVEHQKHKAKEEMHELGEALEREIDGRCTNEDVITEIADVTIMCQQLALIYGEGLVEAEIERKLERLCSRISK